MNDRATWTEVSDLESLTAPGYMGPRDAKGQ